MVKMTAAIRHLFLVIQIKQPFVSLLYHRIGRVKDEVVKFMSQGTSKDAILVTGGDREIGQYKKVKEAFSPAPYVIGVDAGALWLYEAGERIDLAVGDFDSIGEKGFRRLREGGVSVLPFPPEKDFTDTELALDQALRAGAKRLLIYAGLGTRFDHSLANVHLLYRCRMEGVEATIVDRWNRIHLINDGIDVKREYPFLSLIPLSEKVEGVTLTGFKYPLTNATLVWGKGIGISNELIADHGEIRLARGWLLVIESQDEEIDEPFSS
ncbi:Thiamine diphosphokinase [[Clostridium] ultunense Esp]|nr:Thiamine diphosphokinase [[Clostridium] ultunense Esp]